MRFGLSYTHLDAGFAVFKPVTALHQGAPGQMTWLEDPPPWLRPAYIALFR